MKTLYSLTKMKGNLTMTINFEATTYEETAFELNYRIKFAMTCSNGSNERKLFEEVLEETKDMNFLKATIMDCQMQIPDFFSFFMHSVPTLTFIAEVRSNTKNKVFYICY